LADSGDQQATVDFLSRPETYGIDTAVDRIETHAAIVFLAGEKAYKLKRAVHYPYLDFSTLEKRKAVCEAELALNRRTAPDLYIGLQSVNRGPDGVLTLGSGEPVDWLVVMHRFPAASLLDAVAKRGELDDALLRQLIDEIASFHDKAEVVAVPSGARRVEEVIEGNAASTDGLPEGLLPAPDTQELAEESVAELKRLAPLLDRRGATGHVRHCHGDLHLANICLWHGKPTLFDGLEFDSELATIDVLYDLAFLIMDLVRQNLGKQACLAFNRYLDMRDEDDGVAALPLFLAMRAAVRTHVTATAALRQEDSSQRTRKLDEAREYLALARSFLQPGVPCLVAVGGLSGTGKSTLAGALAPEIGIVPGARWLRTDVLRKRIAEVAPETPLPAEAYAPERSAEVYAQLLDAGRCVIVDAVFAKEEQREQLAAIPRGMGIDFIGLWLDAPKDELLARVDGRTDDASDADTGVVMRQLEYELGDLSSWQIVDASGSAAQTLAHARACLGKACQTAVS
jgi:aminoglycoside phosphotransferase family enzyme/predicted kinase